MENEFEMTYYLQNSLFKKSSKIYRFWNIYKFLVSDIKLISSCYHLSFETYRMENSKENICGANLSKNI